MAIITTQWPPSSPSRRPSVLDVDLLFTLGHHTRAHARMQNPLLAPPRVQFSETTSMARERYLARVTRIDSSEGTRATRKKPRSNYHDRTFTLDFQRETSRRSLSKASLETKRPGIIGNFDPFVKRAPTSFDRVTASYFCKRACIVNLGEIPRAWYFFFFLLLFPLYEVGARKKELEKLK